MIEFWAETKRCLKDEYRDNEKLCKKGDAETISCYRFWKKFQENTDISVTNLNNLPN